jgi:hypothetical protein
MDSPLLQARVHRCRLTLVRNRKPAVPFKLHAEHRQHTLLRVLSRPKPRCRVTNWPDYDAALRQRGLIVWFTHEAIAAWRAEPRTTPGGQPHYSALAITTVPSAFAPRPVRFRPMWV